MRTKAKLGDIYGRLTIEKITDRKYGSGSVVVVCACSCGNKKETSMKHLRTGVTQSCDCLRKELSINWASLPKGEAGRNELFNKYKKSALDRRIDFHLTLDEFTKLTSSNCHYCGQKPKNIWQKGRYNGDYVWNGIDRKGSCLHYTTDNTVACCSICNRAKGTVSYNDFLAWVARIVGQNMKELTEVEYTI